MPAASADPLIPLPCRLPTSTVTRLREEAAAAGCTLSDVLRSHLTIAEAKPLGKVRPRFRPARLTPVSNADPALLRGLASIGSNLNQLARAVNAGAIAGNPAECVQVMAALVALERQLGELSGRR